MEANGPSSPIGKSNQNNLFQTFIFILTATIIYFAFFCYNNIETNFSNTKPVFHQESIDAGSSLGLLLESMKETEEEKFVEQYGKVNLNLKSKLQALKDTQRLEEEKFSKDLIFDIDSAINPYKYERKKHKKLKSDVVHGEITDESARVVNSARSFLEPIVIYPNGSKKFDVDRPNMGEKFTFLVDEDLDYNYLGMQDKDIDYKTRKKQFPLEEPKLFYPDTWIEGWPNPKKKYVVLASSIVVSSEHHAKYAFYLPVSAYIWKHYNFASVFVLTGPTETWFTSKLHQLVIQEIRKLKEVVIVYMNATNQNMVTIAQTSRLFVPGNIFYNTHLDDTYFITADSDFWPLTERNHSLHYPEQEITVSRVLSGRRWNSHACALSCVGMKAKTWRDLTNAHDVTLKRFPNIWLTQGFNTRLLWKKPRPIMRNSEELLNFLSKAVGNETARAKVIRGQAKTKSTWFLDQAIFDLYIKTWVEKNGGDVGYEKVFWGKKGDGMTNRINRGGKWGRGIQNIANCQDAHMPSTVYKGNQWSTVRHLMKVIWKRDYFYGQNQEQKLMKDVSIYDGYQKAFEALLIDDWCDKNTFHHLTPGFLRNCTLWEIYKSRVDIRETKITLEQSIWWFAHHVLNDTVYDKKGKPVNLDEKKEFKSEEQEIEEQDENDEAEGQ